MGDNLTSMIFFTTVLFETSFNVYFRKISMEAEVLHTFFFFYTKITLHCTAFNGQTVNWLIDNACVVPLS